MAGDGALSSTPTERLSLLRVVQDFDGFGLDETAAGAGREVTFRAKLPNSRRRGRASIVDEPVVGGCAGARHLKRPGHGRKVGDRIDTLIDHALGRNWSGRFAPLRASPRKRSASSRAARR